jgi:hypothetical protein
LKVAGGSAADPRQLRWFMFLTGFLMFKVEKPQTKAHKRNSKSKVAGFAEKETLSISQNPTYLAGIQDCAIGGTVERPLCNTGIIITLEEALVPQVARTPQDCAAVQVASCSCTFCRRRNEGLVDFRGSVNGMSGPVSEAVHVRAKFTHFNLPEQGKRQLRRTKLE